MASPLNDPTLEALLDRLHAQNDAQASETSAYVTQREQEGTLDLSKFEFDDDMHRFFSDKMVTLDRDKAEFCYLLCRSLKAARVVEAGTSFGVSTLYLAAAVRDNHIADDSCSATTLRRRRDEWIEAGVMERLQEIVLDAYDRMIGLDLSDVAVDGCITKAPCGGQKAGKSPVDRGKQGIKRSTVVDANPVPLGAIAAPANRHDSPLLEETLDTMEILGELPELMRTHLDRGYDSKTTRQKLEIRGLLAEISQKGKPAPLAATKRWVVERTNSWTNAHKKLVWCSERVDEVIDFWLAFSAVIITVGRLIRRGWTHYRWEGRPCRRP